MLTGYPGDGKTTRLNRILSEDHGGCYAVIVNELGQIGVIDLSGCPGALNHIGAEGFKTIEGVRRIGGRVGSGALDQHLVANGQRNR